MFGHTRIKTADDPTQARINSADVWDLEYSKVNSIPSSRRISASHALRKATTLTKLSGSRALDLGCGNGRNSIFLQRFGFSVDALDFSQVALQLASANIDAHGFNKDAILVFHDFTDGLPYADSSFDIILDSYCTCHIIDVREYVNILQEIKRVLAIGGTYIRIHLDSTDQYYTERLYSQDEFSLISFNPMNNTYKRHFSTEQLVSHFDSMLWRSKFFRLSFDDFVDGDKYRRSVSVVVCTKL